MEKKTPIVITIESSDEEDVSKEENGNKKKEVQDNKNIDKKKENKKDIEDKNIIKKKEEVEDKKKNIGNKKEDKNKKDEKNNEGEEIDSDLEFINNYEYDSDESSYYHEIIEFNSDDNDEPSGYLIKKTWSDKDAHLCLQIEVKLLLSTPLPLRVEFKDPIINPNFILSIHPDIKAILPFESSLGPRKCEIHMKDDVDNDEEVFEALNNMKTRSLGMKATRTYERPNTTIDTETVNPLMLRVSGIPDIYKMSLVEKAFYPGRIIETSLGKNGLYTIISYKSVYEAIFALENVADKQFFIESFRVYPYFLRHPYYLKTYIESITEPASDVEMEDYNDVTLKTKSGIEPKTPCEISNIATKSIKTEDGPDVVLENIKIEKDDTNVKLENIKSEPEDEIVSKDFNKDSVSVKVEVKEEIDSLIVPENIKIESEDEINIKNLNNDAICVKNEPNSEIPFNNLDDDKVSIKSEITNSNSMSDSNDDTDSIKSEPIDQNSSKNSNDDSVSIKSESNDSMSLDDSNEDTDSIKSEIKSEISSEDVDDAPNENVDASNEQNDTMGQCISNNSNEEHESSFENEFSNNCKKKMKIQSPLNDSADTEALKKNTDK